MQQLPPEARLFMLAATTAPGGANVEALRSLARAPLNWRLIGHLAEREKLVSVLSRGLRDARDVVPGDVTAALDRRARVVEFRLALLEGALHRTIADLTAIGIPVMLLKGAALAATIYPSFLDRPMGDLDILVPLERAHDAWHHMRRAGWMPEEEGESEFHASYHHLQPLTDAASGGGVLEIHRAAMPAGGPFSLPEADLWRDARPVAVGEVRVRVPSDAHQLLHLCIHFAWSHTLRDGIARTSRDIAWLAERGTIDWPAFAQLSRKAKAATCAFWTLSLARELSQAQIPSDVLVELRPRMPQSTVRALERAYVMSALFRACPSMRVSEMLWSAGIHPARSGHGRSRPWDVNDRYMSLRNEARATVTSRIAAHAADVGPWLRFARLVIGGNTSTPSTAMSSIPGSRPVSARR